MKMAVVALAGLLLAGAGAGAMMGLSGDCTGGICSDSAADGANAAVAAEVSNDGSADAPSGVAADPVADSADLAAQLNADLGGGEACSDPACAIDCGSMAAEKADCSTSDCADITDCGEKDACSGGACDMADEVCVEDACEVVDKPSCSDKPCDAPEPAKIQE